MVVSHNLLAMNAERQFKAVTGKQNKSTEKLSSGYRINRAADDAAGLSISEKMRSQIRGLDKASINASDGISVVQTAEGALNEVHSILQRMNELATQAANDTNTSIDRSQLQLEIDQLTSEIDRISSSTQFNTMNLLDGTFTEKNLQVGALCGQKIEVSIESMSAAGLGLSASGTITKTTSATFEFSSASLSADVSDVSKVQDKTFFYGPITSITTNTSIGPNPIGSFIARANSNWNAPNGSTTYCFYLTAGTVYDRNGDTIPSTGWYTIKDRTNGDSVISKNVIGNSSTSLLLGDITNVTDCIDITSGSPANKDSIIITTTAYSGAMGWSERQNNSPTGQVVNQYTNNQLSENFGFSVSGTPNNGDSVKATVTGSSTVPYGSSLRVDSFEHAGNAMHRVQSAIDTVSSQRAKLGAIQNRLEHTIANLDTSSENTQASESRIRDTDMASEMVRYSINNILANAGQSMLAQANQSTEGVLSLLS